MMKATTACVRTLLLSALASVAFFLSLGHATFGALPECADAEAPACQGTCSEGQGCVTINRGGTAVCVCRNLGCCRIGATTCSDGVTALGCLTANGTWGRGERCDSGCPPTGEPNGSGCVEATECMSDNCVMGVCCDTPCDEPNQACDVPGQRGVCSAVAAPSPTASSTGLLLIVGALLVIGVGALLRRRLAA